MGDETAVQGRGGGPVLVLTGHDLTLDALLDASRRTEVTLVLEKAAVGRMAASRALAEALAAQGSAVYGLTRGLGAHQAAALAAAQSRAYQVRVLREHKAGQGTQLPGELVRCAGILLLNQLAAGRAGVRPAVAVCLAERLSSGAVCSVPLHGSTGVGDVVPMAHLVGELLGDDLPLEVGEALPLVAQGSFSVGAAALACAEAETLLGTLVTLAALDAEALAMNPAPWSARLAALRPHRVGASHAAESLQRALRGSSLWEPGADARALHSPLTFRDAASVLGAALDAASFARAAVEGELNAAQQNPVYEVERGTATPTAHFDRQSLALAMDVARLGLAPCLTDQAERTLKLLASRHTGLPEGLVGQDGGEAVGCSGLAEMAWAVQSLAVEARMLAAPVCVEPVSPTPAAGLEDRGSNAPLGARRLGEMVSLGWQIAAAAAVVACRALDLRAASSSVDSRRVGEGVAAAHAIVRAIVPGGGEPPLTHSMAELAEALRCGKLAAPCEET